MDEVFLVFFHDHQNHVLGAFAEFGEAVAAASAHYLGHRARFDTWVSKWPLGCFPGVERRPVIWEAKAK